MQYNIPESFYRVSVKALVLDKEKRFLLVREKDGRWDFPGGGLDFGETPKECLTREIEEEMGLDVVFIADNPSYFLTSQKENTIWFANVIYLAKIKDLKFTPSDECTEARFFSKEEALKENLISNIIDFVSLYDLKKH
jgi:8-oxo-dGTP diphosphatase